MSLLNRCGIGLTAAVALVAMDSSPGRTCCHGGGPTTASRLASAEDGLVGLTMRALWSAGELDHDAVYRTAPAGVRDLMLEAALIGAGRISERVQFSGRIPFVLHDRASYGAAATGGGIGDVELAGRWDAVMADRRLHLPGFAIELSLVLPTGVAPEDANDPLAVDATGRGAWQLGFSIQSELAFGARREWMASASLGARWRIGHDRTPDAVEGTASVGLAREIGEVTLAFASDLVWEPGEQVAGMSTDQHLVTFGLSLTVPLASRWRALVFLRSPLPIDGLGRNRPLAVEPGLTVLYAGW